MEPCSLTRWDIDIETTAIIARVFFRNVTVTGGVIKGEVKDVDDNPISDLGGTCAPLVGLNIPDVSQITFLFRLKDAASEIGMFLIGYAIATDPEKADFHGTWLAHPPGPDTPPATGEVPGGLVLPGSGDTGTGNGTGT